MSDIQTAYLVENPNWDNLVLRSVRLALAKQAGVTRGCNPPENDRFCPDDPVTRGQMAAFLRRALEG